MSRLTTELIRRILEAEQGIEVVREVTGGTSPARDLIADSHADVIIVGGSAQELIADCVALLDSGGLRRVIAVSADARHAHLYGIRPYEATVDEFSPQFVVDVVRDPDSLVQEVAT